MRTHHPVSRALLISLSIAAGACPREPTSQPVVEGRPLDAAVAPARPAPPPDVPREAPRDVVVAPPPRDVVVPPTTPDVPAPRVPPTLPVPAVTRTPGEILPGALADMPSQPIRCTGNRVIYLDRVSIDDPSGVAVRASGTCAVRLSNCTLRGEVGVEASGRATVHLSQCRVIGTRLSVRASGSAAVRLTTSTLSGATEQTERGFIDGT